MTWLTYHNKKANLNISFVKELNLIYIYIYYNKTILPQNFNFFLSKLIMAQKILMITLWLK